MSIVELLNSKRATPETLLEVMHTSVVELSGDKTERQMEQDLERVLGTQAAVSDAIALLDSHPEAVREIALAWISSANARGERRDIVSAAIRDADRSGPMMETASLTIIALYAMYLLATGAKKTEEESIERGSDGSYRVSKKTTYAGFSSLLKTVAKFFGKGMFGGSDD